MFQEPGPFDDFHSYRFSTFGELRSTDGSFYLFPLSFWMYNSLSLLEPTLGLRIFLSINVIVFIYAVRLFSKDKWIMLFSVLSYPFIFSIVRGNNEVLLAGFALIAIYYYQKKSALSVFFLSTSFLLEPFPSYVALFNFKNIYKLFLSLALGSSLLFMFFISDMTQLLDYTKSLLTFSSGHAGGFYPGSALHSTSLSTFIQIAYALIFGDFPLENGLIVQIVSQIYIFGIFLFVLVWVLFRSSFVYKLISLNCIWLLIYSTSFNYRSVHLIVCFVLLYAKLHKSFTDKILMLTIALICLPKPFFWIITPNNAVGGIESGLIDPILILFLLIFTLFAKKPEQVKTLV